MYSFAGGVFFLNYSWHRGEREEWGGRWRVRKGSQAGVAWCGDGEMSRFSVAFFFWLGGVRGEVKGVGRDKDIVVRSQSVGHEGVIGQFIQYNQEKICERSEFGF